MPSSNNSIYRNAQLIATVCFSLGLISQFTVPVKAQTLPDIPRPQTAGEWGQVYMPVVEQQGALGIGANTDDLEIKGKADSSKKCSTRGTAKLRHVALLTVS